MELEALRELQEVSRGERPADLLIRGGRLINVYSGEIYPANLAVYRDRIAYVGPSDQAAGPKTSVIEAGGRYLCPGYIEPHAHPWVGYNPVTLAEKILPLGTTALVCDSIFFYHQMGARGFAALARDLGRLPVGVWWAARNVPQSATPNEIEEFSLDNVSDLLDLPEVIAMAEITRWTALHRGDPAVLAKILAARARGKRVDGHTAGASAERLNALAAAGVSACHEAIKASEAIDRLRLGFWVMLRQSSLRPDFEALIPGLIESGVDLGRVMLTTDGSSPPFIAEHGFTDGLLRLGVSLGLDPVKAIQMCTLNPATFFGLDQEIGGLAPGRRADILILPDLTDFRPDLVIAGGRLAAKEGRLQLEIPHPDWDSYGGRPVFDNSTRWMNRPETFGVPAPDGAAEGEPVSFPVIDLVMNVITRRADLELPVRGGFLDPSGHPGLLHICLVDRAGRWITRGFIRGLAGRLEGFASTYNTTQGILAMGTDRQSMATALADVARMNGGIALVEEGRPIYRLPLPIAGMMNDLGFDEMVGRIGELREILEARGYPYHDPLYTMLFITCDFLPDIKITPAGIMDIKNYRVIHPVRPLAPN